MGVIIVSDVNKERLGQLGACETLVRHLQDVLYADPFGSGLTSLDGCGDIDVFVGSSFAAIALMSYPCTDNQNRCAAAAVVPFDTV